MKKIIIALLAVLFLAGCAGEETGKAGESAGMEEPGGENSVKTTPEGLRYIVDPRKILSGGPPKDGIPSIDNPKFVSVEEADGWIQDSELVLAIIYKEIKRVYPLQIMVWHEIVNEDIAGDPILITYCPLCGSGIAYERKIDGEAVEFGTSGNLYNSNLVMYDRKTGTYWSQIDGLAIVGELAGMELREISVDTVAWRDWKNAHPDSEVLSQETGFNRQYGTDPYGSYYEESFLIFPVENEDDRIHPKTVIFGIEVDGIYKAYREDDLKEAGKIDDTVGGAGIRIERDPAGIVKITDIDTGDEIVKERGFWFAWYAFHPDTLLYGPDIGPAVPDESTAGPEPTLPKLPEPAQEETPAAVPDKTETGPKAQANEINVTAKRWEFMPSVIEVNKGDTVRLNLKSIDVDHGFRMPEFGINERLEAGKELIVEFAADKAGEFEFYCNIPCGSGHSQMRGRLIVR